VSVVVGLPRDERATTALHLGALLARSLGEDLLVATVVPPPWPPGMGRVDAEYQAWLDRDAEDALDRARDLVPRDVAAEFRVVRARSTAHGLAEVAEQHGASVLALGSSDAGVLGRVAFGSVAERLLHTSPVPVALAPRGFRSRPGTTVRRVGSRAEESVLGEWSSEVERAQRAVLDQVAALPAGPAETTAVIAHGTDWAGAISEPGWDDGDLLAVGSSSAGPLAKVFIGSRSSKIVRHSPVPVVVVPRGAAEVLAERAERA
jgi:nucleotide-binding universal stress UspA family protein